MIRPLLYRLSKKLFPTIEALCKDKDPKIRGTICVRLPEVIAKLKDKERVIPLLNGLLGDTDPHVMGALVGALGKAIMLINSKDPKANQFYQTALPIFKKFVKRAYVDGNTNLLVEFTSNFGPVTSILSGMQAFFCCFQVFFKILLFVCSEASGILSNSDKLWMLDAYLQLCRYGLPSSQFAGKGNEQAVSNNNCQSNHTTFLSEK